MGEPFLHWVGGKRQLLNVLDANLPVDIKNLRLLRSTLNHSLVVVQCFSLKNNYKIKGLSW